MAESEIIGFDACHKILNTENQLSAISYQLSAISYQLSAISYQK